MGKSASGKSTIANTLVKEFGYNKYKTVTTRPQREGESDDEYIFMNDKKFWKMEMRNKFIENMAYHTLVNDTEATWNYATPKMRKWCIGTEYYVVVLTPCGARKFIDYYGKQNCSLFLIKADDEVRKERAKRRGSFDNAEWERRLITDSRDFSTKTLSKYFNEKDYLTIYNNRDIMSDIMYLTIMASI